MSIVKLFIEMEYHPILDLYFLVVLFLILLGLESLIKAWRSRL